MNHIYHLPEHQTLRDQMQRFLEREVEPYGLEWEKAGKVPREVLKKMGQAGFFGLMYSSEYGGAEADALTNLVFAEALSQSTFAGFIVSVLVHTDMASPHLHHAGTPAQKAKYMPSIIAGDTISAVAMTEPGAGSDLSGMKSTAKRDGDGWVLNGTKYWTSGLDEADSVMVVCRSDKVDEKGRHPLSLFIVPANAPGISRTPIETALYVPETSFTVFFDNVQLGPEALVGQEGQGLKQVFAGLNPERVCAAAINNGIARYAIERGSLQAQERSVWGVPIGQHQGLAHPLAKSFIAVQQARLMAARAAQLFDAGSPDAGEAANMAKFAAADASLEALDQAIQIHGGNGMALEYGLADLWFIARLHKTAPVSREMILNFVAQHSLGLPKSY